MESFFRKYGWALTLALIAVGAVLMALMANNVLASQLAPYTVPEIPQLDPTPDHATRRRANAGRKKTWDRAISKLCLFGCPDTTAKKTCPGGCADDEQCQDGQCVAVDTEPQFASDVPVLSDLNMKVLGAMVANPGQYSMALIHDDESDETLVAVPGDLVADNAELVNIRRDRIIIRRNGHLEYIRMDKTIAGQPSATPVSTVSNATRSAPTKPRRPAPSAEPVEQVGKDQFKVQRAAIDKRISNRHNLAKQGQVVPNYKNGKRDGLKLVGVGSDSVYSQLGIQSGDVIQSVNGHQIQSPRQAMEFFEKIKSEPKVSVEIERRGQKRRLKYNIE